MRRFAALLIAIAAVLAALMAEAQAGPPSRIKDLVDVEGVRENQLVGYGLVVGLNGTGDKLKDGSFTKQSLQSMLNRLGVKPTEKGTISKNVAAVMVTATLPPFARQGSRIDVSVSALGDATNLLGGTLLVTPLLGADGEVYAVAQGQVGVAGFSAKGQGESIVKGVPTSGRIASGAIIEREVGFEMARMDAVTLTLRSPDFTTRAAHRPGDQRLSRRAGGAAERSQHGPHRDPRRLRRQRRQSDHRHRAAAHRARPAGPDRHRRDVGHHRHGRERARLDRRHRPGQPDHPDHRGAARSRSHNRSAMVRRWSCRAPTSRSTSSRTAGWASSAAASPCSNWSTA